MHTCVMMIMYTYKYVLTIIMIVMINSNKGNLSRRRFCSAGPEDYEKLTERARPLMKQQC